MSDLKHQAVQGGFWTAASTAAMTAALLVKMAVLGRLLAPGDFGLAALFTVIVELARVISNFGLREALIQRSAPTVNELSSLYWLHIGLGAVVYGFVLVASPLIAGILGAPKLAQFLAVAALAIQIDAFGAQFRALAQKQLHFKFCGIVEAAGAAAGMFVSIAAAALWDQGTWSFVWGLLATATLNTSGFILYGWSSSQEYRPRMIFEWRGMRSYLQFGLFRVGALSVGQLRMRLDRILIGALLGPEALGFYSVSQDLVLRPAALATSALSKVAFPIFLMVTEDNQRLRNAYLRLVHFLALLQSPILVGLAVTAPTFLPLLLGDKWTPAIPVVQILALFAFVRSFGTVAGSLILARGRADWEFWWSVSTLVLVPPLIYAAVSLTQSLVHVAAALLFFQVILLVVHYAFLIRRLLGACLRRYVLALLTPLLLGAAMAAAILAFDQIYRPGMEIAHLLVQVLLGVVTYTALLVLFERRNLQELRTNIFRR